MPDNEFPEFVTNLPMVDIPFFVKGAAARHRTARDQPRVEPRRTQQLKCCENRTMM